MALHAETMLCKPRALIVVILPMIEIRMSPSFLIYGCKSCFGESGTQYFNLEERKEGKGREEKEKNSKNYQNRKKTDSSC